MGFDPMVNQRLLPPTFPRYTKIKPRIDALEYLLELINRFKMVTKITNHTGFHAALVIYDKLAFFIDLIDAKFTCEINEFSFRIFS